MAKNRYARDYELLEDITPDGRFQTRVRYKGDYYRFVSDERQIRRMKRRCMICCAAGWAGYIGAMLLPGAAMRVLFVSLSFAAIAVPLFLLTQITAVLVKAGESVRGSGAEAVGGSGKGFLRRREADLFNHRFPAAAFFVMIFSLAALAGSGVALLTGTVFLSGDWLWLAGDLLLAFCGGVLFRSRGVLAVEAAAGREAEDIRIVEA